MKNKISVVKHQDAGHGWLAVKRQQLEELGLLDKISGSSYQSAQGGKTVYLEEDQDASLFLKTCKEKDIEVEVKKTSNYESSPIRRYPSFSNQEEKPKAQVSVAQALEMGFPFTSLPVGINPVSQQVSKN